VKIISFFFLLVFLAFAFVQLNDEYWLPWVIVYLFSAYTAACSFRNYYNPMLLMLMVSAYILGGLFYLPEGGITDWFGPESGSENFNLASLLHSELRESLGLFICAIVNTWYMFTGFEKAKKPGYNSAFSVSARNK
jgi:ABC-type multidrug transport system fused ATPase/permease subunit